MIVINLAPAEELEDKQWYLADLVIFLVIAVSSYGGAQFFLSHLQDSIELTKTETLEFERSYKKLKPDLERYATLNRENDLLIKKLNSLKQITVSKIARYKPIIILEYLQNLKPDGVWFSHLYDDTDHSIIRLVGGALDNLLVAEFMASLAATRFQESDASDLRTQIYFSNIYLERVASERKNPAVNATATRQNSAASSVELRAFKATEDSELLASKGQAYWQSTAKKFPELSTYPGFELNIKYEERPNLTQALEPDNNPKNTSEK